MSNNGLIKSDLEKIVEIYSTMRTPQHRYASFDYCFNYFQLKKTNPNFSFVDNMERSCNVLGFYLASWGMYRGSSYLLQYNMTIFKSLIEYIDSLEEEYWLIDLPYSGKDIELLTSLYDGISERIKVKIGASVYKEATTTLVTKIMLGIWGSVPAFDSYFAETFKQIFKSKKCSFKKFNNISLSLIDKFYSNNQSIIDRLSSKYITLDFDKGTATNLTYTKAKIIDMYGFQFEKKLISDVKKMDEEGKSKAEIAETLDITLKKVGSILKKKKDEE